MPKITKKHWLMGGLALIFLLAAYLDLQLSRPSSPQLPQLQPTPIEPEADSTPIIVNDNLSQPGPMITVKQNDGSLKQLSIEQFLIGVVAAEMPASFGLEALKAQAIAARTYIISNSTLFGKPRHDDADTCTNHAHCQAYSDIETLKARWGADFAKNYQLIFEAIESTAGLVIFYDGELAESPYSSTCGGETEAAHDVWGNAIPYLQSVACAWDSHAPRYSASISLSTSEAANKLDISAIDFSDMQLSYTDGGGIDQAIIGDTVFSGTQLRSAWGLNSTSIDILINQEDLLISTRGYGHGVGLCQYGADGMAKAGYTAEEIISHYYQGVEIVDYFD